MIRVSSGTTVLGYEGCDIAVLGRAAVGATFAARPVYSASGDIAVLGRAAVGA